MNKFFLKLITLLSLTVSVIYPGVYILIDLPNEVTGIVQQYQQALADKIKEINEQQDSSYIFANVSFSPHISLAFVSQEQLSIQATKEKFPELQEALEEISQEFSAIDLSDTFKNLMLDIWQGRFEIECGGSKKKNYINIILKANLNAELARLSAKVTEMLQKKYNIKQIFPFSMHLTIGRICDANDEPISHEFDNDLKEKFSNQVSNELSDIIVTDFKLKGHDASEEVFDLSSQ